MKGQQGSALDVACGSAAFGGEKDPCKQENRRAMEADFFQSRYSWEESSVATIFIMTPMVTRTFKASRAHVTLRPRGILSVRTLSCLKRSVRFFNEARSLLLFPEHMMSPILSLVML